MSLPKNIPVVRSLVDGARCTDCNSDRVVMLSTEVLKTNLHLAKCIDCGSMGVLCESKEVQEHLVIFMSMLEQWQCLNFEIPVEIIEFYQRAKEVSQNVN